MDFYITLVYVIFIQLFLQSRLGSTTTCTEVASTVGSSFVFGVPTKLFSTKDFIYIHITAVSGLPTLVNISAPFINYNKQFTVFNSTIVTLNQSLVNMEEGVHFTGIEVVSKANISVAVNIYSTSITKGFLVLPTSALSTRYIAASYQPCRSCNSSVIVIGTEDSTTASINYKTNGQAQTSFQNFTLKTLESYQLTANSDLSGAVIISSKPVAVLSGASISRVPIAIGNNYAMEQMIPTKYWVNEYIVPPIYPHNYFMVRIFVDEGDTDISFINSSCFIRRYFEKESMHEVMFGSDPALIMATKPISVFQYYVDNENTNGSFYMTTVQGISQYVNSYRFNTETFSGIYNTVALTVTQRSLNGIKLNGRNLSSWITKTVPVSPPRADYITVFINITYSSFFILENVDGVKFGATLYGLVFNNDNYGYPLQLSLFSKSECLASSATSDVTGIPTNYPEFDTISVDTYSSRCKDTETDCADYGFDYICQGHDYIAWSSIHCAKFCNLCPELVTDSSTSSVTSTMSTTSHYEFATDNDHADANRCQDKDANCAIYGFDYICHGDYIPWSTIHCAKFCNLCPATTAQTELTTQTTVMQTVKTTPTTVLQTAMRTTPPTTILQTLMSTTTPTTVLQTLMSTTTPTTVLQTSQITTRSSTSNMITTNEAISFSPNTTTFLTNSSLMCYTCNDMSQMDLCDVVQWCKDSEICFVERYWQYDRQLFRSGCMGKDICQRNEVSSHNIPGRCVQCCHEAFCNHQGCGDPGLPAKPHRGPICFDCPYESSPLNCTKLTVCEKGEFCSIQEFRLWGEHFHFILGCGHGQCQQSVPASHVLTRSVPVCSLCCYDDYCNRNCTNSNDGHHNVIPVG